MTGHDRRLWRTCRDWVLSTYGKLKQANPALPILVREAESVKAKLIARFGALVHRS